MFQPEAMRLIAELSRGLPRRVNVLCDRTLQEGRVDSERLIGPDLVKRAAKSLAGAHTLAAPAADAIGAREPVSVLAIPDVDPLRLRGGSELPRSAGRRVLVILLGLGGMRARLSIRSPTARRRSPEPRRRPPPPRLRVPSQAE